MNALEDGGALPPDLSGRTAVVTGAARGIGRAVAARLARCGATVVAVDSDEAELRASAGDGWLPVPGDLSRLDAAGLAEEILQAHGLVELIVNNVGITTPHGFLDLSEADFDRVFRANLRGPWFFTRRLVRDLVAHRSGGSIVFVSSVHDSFVRLHPHYSSSKAAIAMLAREMANELARYGIRVNVVAPGSIRTASNPASPEADERVRSLVPAGRRGEPEEVANVVVALLSDRWFGYVTGAEVRVDGGLALHSWVMDE